MTQVYPIHKVILCPLPVARPPTQPMTRAGPVQDMINISTIYGNICCSIWKAAMIDLFCSVYSNVRVMSLMLSIQHMEANCSAELHVVSPDIIVFYSSSAGFSCSARHANTAAADKYTSMCSSHKTYIYVSMDIRQILCMFTAQSYCLVWL